MVRVSNVVPQAQLAARSALLTKPNSSVYTENLTKGQLEDARLANAYEAFLYDPIGVILSTAEHVASHATRLQLFKTDRRMPSGEKYSNGSLGDFVQAIGQILKKMKQKHKKKKQKRKAREKKG